MLPAVGLALITASVVDLVWTTMAAGAGAGPVTGRTCRLLWRAARRVAWRNDERRHRRVALAGVLITLAALVQWILLIWVGWWLVFNASDDAVIASSTGEPADALSRAYFTGYSVFTLGNGDYRPGGALWQVATVAATATGLVLVTLAITYLVPLASAVTQRRQLAAYISSLSHRSTPEELLVSAWTGKGFPGLAQHLVALTPLIHVAGQRHLTYPMLHYFHSRDRRTAAAPSLAVLDEALTLLRCAVHSEARLPPATVIPTAAAVDGFLDTLAGAFIHPGQHPLSPPDLAVLRRAGIPTVDDATFCAALDELDHHRRLLSGLVAHNGWDGAVEP